MKMVEADGWYFVGQEGSHCQYKHSVKKGRVTIQGKPGKDVKAGGLEMIARGLK